MSWFIIAIIVVLVAGLMFFGGYTPKKERTREQFLKELSEYLEGTLEPIEGKENSYRIRFSFEGVNFIYDNVQNKGFKDTFFNSYLKAESASHLNLDFTEREHKKFIRSDMFKPLNQADENVVHNRKVAVPKKLEEFNIFSNNPEQANELLNDQKVLKVILSFKNVDTRGYHFVSLKIVDGIVILEFHPSGLCNPTPLEFMHSFDPIENLLDKLLIIVNKLRIMS